jgi:filamentous hemagglutinin family protein
MYKGLSPILTLASFGLINCLFSSLVNAQEVTSDGTTNTTVNDDGQGNFNIEQGDRSGNNLFHSFGDFSVPTDGSAAFNNAADISNIFSRVTGGNISNIDGLIQTNGSANLFLINPAGIIFGNGARLDVGGSFYGSSASSILFEDGEFSATDLTNPPLITINAPIGFGFRDEPGDIVNRSNFGLTSRVIDETINPAFSGAEFTILESAGLTVNPKQTIALVGGNVILENASGITAPGGLVELGGLTEAGKVLIDNDGSLTFPQGISKGNVTLTEQSRVLTASGGGGFINVNAKNLELSGLSELYTGIAEDSGSVNAQAGDITINATESVKLIGSGGREDNPFVFVGNDYDTAIRNYVGLKANSAADPNLGRNPKSNSTARGNSGSIIIDTNFLQISDRAAVVTKTYGEGNTGDIRVIADDIQLNGGDFLDQVVSGAGDVGDITISTETLAINEKFSFILADNISAGNAGNIIINARDSIFINGGGGEGLGTTLSAILSQVQTDVVGDAGDITISTPQLSLTNFGLISTNVKQGSTGSTGNIFLDVGNLSLNNGSVIEALTENNFDGGSIQIKADNLSLDNGGKIVTSGDSGGDAGNIILDIANTITLENGNPPLKTPFSEPILQNTAGSTGIFASSLAGSTGNGGSINVNAGSIELLDNGSIAAVTQAGTGGNITLQTTKDIILRNNSSISAEAFNKANGGNLSIDTRFIIAFPNQNSDILADAQQGVGGNITINAESLLGIEARPLNNLTNDINASSKFDLDGTVNVNTPDVNPTEGATELPVNRIQEQEQVAQTCSSNQAIGIANNLLLTGKGGLSTSPVAPLSSEVLVNSESAARVEGHQKDSLASLAINTNRGKIIPARGVIRTKDGRIVLIATPTTGDASRISNGSSNCSPGKEG